MARSIHVTRRTIRDLHKFKFKSQEEQSEALEAAYREKARKNRIKVSVRADRHRSPSPLEGTDIHSIPIEVREVSESIHFPAEPREIRELLSMLPQASTEGITRILLCLGKQDMDEKCEDDLADERDPHTQRLAFPIFPGVFTGPVLGSYSARSGLMKLYAYVYQQSDIEKLRLPLGAFTLYLRLHFFKTLMHEVAHHHDHLNRVRRGRWLADRSENNENYAERMEYEWTRDFVIPYLQRNHPGEEADLLSFIKQWGGAQVSLDFLAGDPRCTLRSGLKRLAIGTESAFEILVEKLHSEENITPLQSRLAFAWQVHYCDHYELCLQIVNDLLHEYPGEKEALLLKADTLVHLEDFDNAWELATKVLERDPQCEHAWEIHADVLECKQEWERLLQHVSKWPTTLHSASTDKYFYAAIACCALGRLAEMEDWISAILARQPKRKTVRRIIFRRAGKKE